MSMRDFQVGEPVSAFDQTVRTQGFEFTGKHMLACMVCFFGVIIVVNFFMATMASRTWTGLVVKNSYVASQQFNVDLAASAAQAAKGWRSVVAYSKGVLTVEVSNRKGVTPTFSEAVISYGRPVFEQKDTTVRVPVNAAGRAVLPVALAQGDWFIRFETYVDGEPYRRDARLSVLASGVGEVQ